MDTLRALFKVAIGILGAAIVTLALRVVFGAVDGEPCRHAYECARLFGAACASDPHGRSFCSRRCASASDCASGWSCVRSHEIGNFEYIESAVCAPPEETEEERITRHRAEWGLDDAGVRDE
jgi:hypothetical protein